MPRKDPPGTGHPAVAGHLIGGTGLESRAGALPPLPRLKMAAPALIPEGVVRPPGPGSLGPMADHALLRVAPAGEVVVVDRDDGGLPAQGHHEDEPQKEKHEDQKDNDPARHGRASLARRGERAW